MQYYLLNPFFKRVVAAAAADALCMLTAAGLTWWVLQPVFPPLLYAACAAAMTFACFMGLFYADAYRPSVLASGGHTLTAISVAMSMAFVAGMGLYFLVPVPSGVVPALAHAGAFYFPLLVVERGLFRSICALPRFSNRVVIVGLSDLALALADELQQSRRLGLDFVGYASDEMEIRGELVGSVPVLGKVHELEKIIDELGIGIIVVASKSRREHFPADTLLAAKLRGLQVISGVRFYERITGKIFLRDLRPSYLIFGDGCRMGLTVSAAKRAIDVAVASFGLLLSAPVLGLCAAAIKFESPGPVLFRQERVGRDGRSFRICKLRSMGEGAERETGPVWAKTDDPRITKVGHVLRKTRLDEVPQLWNVLVGEMSMVGPRPERPEFVEQLADTYPLFRARNAVKPGVTGWAQIRYGYVGDVESVEEKLALDLYYLKTRSLTMDLLILWYTVKTVVMLRGR